jgi:hypothetical protein
MTSNQRRQLQHLRRNWPVIAAQVAAEVGELDDVDAIQKVISRGIYTAAGWWGWMADATITAAEMNERRDVATYDPHYVRLYGQWERKY